MIARTRAAAARAARRRRRGSRPRLADSPTGFTTHGKPDLGERSSGSSTTDELGLGHLARGQLARIDALSRVAATASGGLCGKPSRSPAAAATSTPWSSTATTASIGGTGVEGHDHSGGGLGVVEGHDDRPVAHVGRQRLLLLGTDDHLDAQVRRGPHEVGRPVGGCGEQEENAGHGRIMEDMSELLTITEEARAKVLEVRAAEPEADTLALWVEVNGEQAGAYTYLMEFPPVGRARRRRPGAAPRRPRGRDPRRQRRAAPGRHPRLQRRHGDAEPQPPGAGVAGDGGPPSGRPLRARSPSG